MLGRLFGRGGEAAGGDCWGYGLGLHDLGDAGRVGVRVLIDPAADPAAGWPPLGRNFWGPVWDRWADPQTPADRLLVERCERPFDPSTWAVCGLPPDAAGRELAAADVVVPAGGWVDRFLAYEPDERVFRLRLGRGATVRAAARLSAADAARRRVEAVGRTGVRVTARLLQANRDLYEPGDGDRAAMVLVTFDPAVRPARLEELAAEVYRLKELDPAHPGAAGPVASEQGWRYHRRFRLPADLTGGPAVFACDLWVPRACLPGGCIGDRWLRCVADPGDDGGVELLPPGG